MWALADLLLVHHLEHDLGEPAGVVGAAGRLAGGAEAGQVGRVDPVALAQRRRGLEQRGACAAQPVQQQHVGPVAHRQRRDPVASRADVVDLQQRRAAAGEPEHALEGDGVVEVAAHRQQPALEGLDAGEVALAQRQPGLGVGGQGHVRLVAGGALADPGAVAGAADLPGVPEVAELDVVGGVKPGLGAQVAIGQGPEGRVDGRQPGGLRGVGRHGQT